MQYKRIIKQSRQSFFLFGPRGVGKSTWLREHYKADATFNLLEEKRYQEYLRDPGTFGRELSALPEGSRVVVDEIQRLPDLLNEVHRFIEEKNMTFVLSGSSARKLKRSGVNLLAGRALRRLMFPLLPEELGADFDLETVLRYGSIAVIWGQEEKEEALSSCTRATSRGCAPSPIFLDCTRASCSTRAIPARRPRTASRSFRCPTSSKNWRPEIFGAPQRLEGLALGVAVVSG